MPKAKVILEVAPQESEGAIFEMKKDELRTLARMLVMQGKLTDSREEKRTSGSLFTQFGGIVTKNPPSVMTDVDGNETSVESGKMDVIMSNKSKNAYGNLVFNVGAVQKEGSIHCGDANEFARIASKVDMGEIVKLTFTSEATIFTDESGVDISIRNDEYSTLEYVENAKTMKEKLDMSGDFWSYSGSELKTTINMDVKELLPIIKDNDILGLMSYPIEVKKDEEGKFYLKAKAISKDKVTINRKIKEIEVIGDECESAYAVGLDSVVANISGKILIHIGDWKPMVIVAENEKYNYTLILANVKQGQENEVVFNVSDDVFNDGTSSDDDSDSEDGDDYAPTEDSFI